MINRNDYDYGPDMGRICSSCRLLKPLDAFGSSLSSSPDHLRIVCKECLESQASTNKLIKEKSARDEKLRMVIARASGDSINVPHISELAAEMIRQLGGLEEFCQLWKYHIYACLEKNPASMTLSQNLKAIGAMVTQSTKERQTAPDVQALSDEELEKELQRLLEQSSRITTDVDPEENVA